MNVAVGLGLAEGNAVPVQVTVTLEVLAPMPAKLVLLVLNNAVYVCVAATAELTTAEQDVPAAQLPTTVPDSSAMSTFHTVALTSRLVVATSVTLVPTGTVRVLAVVARDVVAVGVGDGDTVGVVTTVGVVFSGAVLLIAAEAVGETVGVAVVVSVGVAVAVVVSEGVAVAGVCVLPVQITVTLPVCASVLVTLVLLVLRKAV